MATNNTHLSVDEFDEKNYPRPETNDFDNVVERALSRRGFLGGVMAFGTTAALSTAGLSSKFALAEASTRFGFESIPTSTANTITVPPGFNWHVATKWGEPLFSNVAFDANNNGTADTQEKTVGDNNDGMAMFSFDGKQLLASNNEYTQNKVVLGNEDGMPTSAEETKKLQAAHGITIAEMVEKDNQWSIVVDSPFNRRITANTEFKITGPAAGHDLLKTEADPTGTASLGTWNNCGNGRTPWGTYISCEENFNGYFGSSDKELEIPEALKRYGVAHDSWHGWENHDPRFDVSKNPNEPNRNGYIVEIDPTDPNSTPVKRTALGRFKHENAELVINKDGTVVVYMGDDERGEFIYRFVADKKYSAGGDNSDILESGKLYAAKFNDNLTGEWLALTPETTGMKDQAEICIHTRQAASAVGATTMDRPEWVSANPKKAEIYCCLTNNKNRGVKPNKGGDETPVGGPNPRAKNHYGQIVRWRPVNQDHTSTSFSWDLYAVAGNPSIHSDEYAGSDNINESNMFNSPDGLAFDSNGMLWIQTDGNYSNEGDFAGQGNNQMLVGDPTTGEIRRFMTGPKKCEVTGFAWSADRRTLFVGIQHPSKDDDGAFPDGADTLPRSCVVAIQRDDNRTMG